MHFDWPDVWQEQLNAALGAVAEAFDVTAALKSMTGDRELSSNEKAFFRAFDYMLTPSRHVNGEVPSPYSPVSVYDQGAYPERLEAATEDTLRAWADGFELSDGISLALARLGDLLWCRKFGEQPHQYARTAFSAMVDLVEHGAAHAVARMDLLIRAIDLAAELGDSDLRQTSARLAISQAALSLADQEYQPGVTLGILERLVMLRKRDQPVEVTDLLNRTAARYADDPFIREACTELQLQGQHEPGERRRLVEQTIASWEAKAGAEGGLLAQHSIKRALDFARRFGTKSDVDRLLGVLQSTPPDELQPISGTVSLDRTRVGEFIGSFTVGDRSIWLARLALYCPIKEDREQTHREVRQLMQDFPLQYLVSRTILNDDGLPIAQVQAEDEHFAAAVRDSDSQGIQIWSLFAADVLKSFADQDLGVDDIRGYFVDGVVSDEEAEGIARAWAHYLAGDYEEAALLCLPRIEACLRRVARSLDLVVYEEPRVGRLGGYVGLGAILQLLQGRVPEEHRIYLQRMLCDPLSLNLRNRLLHGLSLGVSANEAALVVHAATILGVWRS